jgi:class 3 adenylate cyclase/pimeloyl-ACP methyl ester carboxylesterase
VGSQVERRLAAILAADIVGFSSLMGLDEVGTLRNLKAHRRELIDPAITSHHGRIVKTTGDGLLVEFGSIVDAVACAVAVQRGMIARNAEQPKDQRIVLRIGINVGDIIIDGGDIFGDGVNVAARLEALCEPGGLCISRAANDQIRDKLTFSFEDRGEQTVKNIARAIGVFGLGAEDIAALEQEALPTWDREAAKPVVHEARKSLADEQAEQIIRFCRAPDGVRLAYSSIGRGPPVVKTGHWMTHLEKDIDGPIWNSLYSQIIDQNTLIRYDARGNGLSDWEVDEISFESFVQDLETVADAAGVKKFSLLGISQGCAISVAYAARHPERISKLILYGGYSVGSNRIPDQSAATKEARSTMISLLRVGWGQENPAFRQFFTTRFIPDATKEQADWFNELQRISTSPENAVRNFLANGEADVSDELSKIAAPTLVMHARDEVAIPLDRGRSLAAGIPGARFISLPSRNHLILESEPAFARFANEIVSFLRD